MGGKSESRCIATNRQTALFKGTVSFENNGGFASVRANFSARDLSQAEGISLRLRGDGKRYKFRLFHSSELDAVAYEVSFATTRDVWQEEVFSFSEFVPKWRGRQLKDASALERSNVSGLGFLVSDRQLGSFVLELDWIRAY